MNIFAELNIKVITYLAALAEAGTILTTWYLCAYVEGSCPALPHLPTISDTWVPAPGNYLSRWVTAVVCIVMGVAQWVIYAINTGKTGFAPHITNNQLASGISIVGFVSCVLLSWVAAICDNDNAPSCRGNGTIHSIFAVSFFIGYNVMMAVSTFSKPQKRSAMASSSPRPQSVVESAEFGGCWTGKPVEADTSATCYSGKGCR